MDICTYVYVHKYLYLARSHRLPHVYAMPTNRCPSLFLCLWPGFLQRLTWQNHQPTMLEQSLQAKNQDIVNTYKSIFYLWSVISLAFRWFWMHSRDVLHIFQPPSCHCSFRTRHSPPPHPCQKASTWPVAGHFSKDPPQHRPQMFQAPEFCGSVPQILWL